MKSNSNKIIYAFIFLSLIFAFASYLLFIINPVPESYFFKHLVLEIIFIVTVGFVIRFFILKNNKENIHNFRKLENSNIEIREAKERYDIVAKATSDTIWDWDIKNNEFIFNKGIQGIFGYLKEEVGTTSKWWFERIHPEDTLRISVSIYSFLQNKSQKWQDEYRFKCKDGNYKYILDRGFLIFDDAGALVRMIGAMQDITQRKTEEQRLRLLETVIINTKDAVIITDADNSAIKIPKIVFVNEAFSVMSGYENKDVIGKSPIMFYDDNVNNAALNKLVLCLKNVEECEIESLTYKKSGAEYWVQFSMVPVFNSEKIHTHWISIQRDITERKNQEKEKEQLIKELTQNNKDLRQFSYITSHNLRSPLSNLIGLLKLTEDIEIKDEELKMILDGFSKSTYLLNETIIDLGKVVIIRDNPSIEKQNVVLVDAINKVLSQIGILVKKTKPTIATNINRDVLIYSNKAYLESIILNLITNSIKYKSEKRPLKIEIDLVVNEIATILIFKDNGLGIDLAKHKDKIFGMYQKFHNYADSKGLGLYLIKSQIESMGGNITVESEVDKGTKFIIYFKNQV
jgi:PAS domain S-box-containing protein